jgi:hypothetical protein
VRNLEELKQSIPNDKQRIQWLFDQRQVLKQELEISENLNKKNPGHQTTQKHDS